jgi:hydrogenase-4 membrane subunit HyfE
VVNPYAIYRLLKRLWQAATAVMMLITDRETTRQLPWAYLRRRAITDRWMIAQLVAMFFALVVMPVSSAMPDGIRQSAYVVVFIVVFCAAWIPWLRGKRQNSADSD